VVSPTCRAVWKAHTSWGEEIKENQMLHEILSECPQRLYSPILSLRFKKAPAADWLANRLSPLPANTSSTYKKQNQRIDTITHSIAQQ
jgi:hypothetical protein